MKIWFFRTLLIVIVAATAAMLFPGIREFLAVDGCLDAGGVYDYSRHTCRTDVQTLPSEPVRLLRSPDRGSIIVALAISVAMARLFATMDRRRRAAASAA